MARLEHAADGSLLHFSQPVQYDDHGVVRFRENKILVWLFDTGKLDLNEVATRGFTDADRAQVAQMLGYSVSGWSDLSYVSPEMAAVADETAGVLYDISKQGL